MTDRAVCGTTNPLSAECEFAYEGDEVVVTTVLGAAFEGAPRRSHGGWWRRCSTTSPPVLPVAGVAAYTGELTVRYLAPVPIEEPLEFRARIDAHEGRKLRASADCSAAGRVVATRGALHHRGHRRLRAVGGLSRTHCGSGWMPGRAGSDRAPRAEAMGGHGSSGTTTLGGQGCRSGRTTALRCPARRLR